MIGQEPGQFIVHPGIPTGTQSAVGIAGRETPLPVLLEIKMLFLLTDILADRKGFPGRGGTVALHL
ncbi:MAG: hypothetical protein DRP64_02175 [Verrucomicrobia bacterium]|nr:MAG: hypothetical protein DRP64_02175 [Verrucomicrobiota bacterium]